MKFVCEQCGSKYSIADHKVANKTLKIKCKKCNGIISISDPSKRASKRSPKDLGSSSLESSPSPAGKGKLPPLGGKPILPSLPSLEKPPETVDKEERVGEGVDEEKASPCWFVGIDGAPRGPISTNKIRSLKSSGKINDESLVWKEGMPEWTPLAKVEALTSVLERIEETTATAKIGEIEDLPPSSARVSEGATVEAESAFFQDESEKGLREVETQSADEMNKDAPAAIGIEIEDGVGTLRSLVPPKPAGGMQNRTIMIAAIGFFAVSLVTLGVALFGGGDSDEANTSVQTVEKVIERVVYLDKPAEDSSLLSITDRPPRVEKGEAVETAVEGKTLKASKDGLKASSEKAKSKEPDAKTKELLERMGLSAPSGSALAVGADSSEQRSNGSSSGQTLTANQVKAVVDKNKRGLKSCYERALKQGEAPDDRDIRVDFNMTVGSSGTVKRVRLSGEGAGIASLNGCLERSVGRWVFPPSSQDSPVEFPFVFSPR